MGQVRITMQRVSAGSAASQAEQESREYGTPKVRRVEAGSAARMAEEAKRAGMDAPSGMASISLRAQGGRVQRTDLVPADRLETPKLSTKEGQIGAAKAAALEPTQSAEQESTAFPLQAGLPQDKAGQLKSFLRRLFLPEEPSQP